MTLVNKSGFCGNLLDEHSLREENFGTVNPHLSLIVLQQNPNFRSKYAAEIVRAKASNSGEVIQ